MPHDDRIRAMLLEGPEAIPASVYILPAAWMRHREALDAVTARYPEFFGEHRDGRDYDAVGQPTYTRGRHVDAWG